jgi:hypothetical protein
MTMGQWRNETGKRKPRSSEKNMFLYHFAHTFHMDWLGIQHRPLHIERLRLNHIVFKDPDCTEQ